MRQNYDYRITLRSPTLFTCRCFTSLVWFRIPLERQTKLASTSSQPQTQSFVATSSSGIMVRTRFSRSMYSGHCDHPHFDLTFVTRANEPLMRCLRGHFPQRLQRQYNQSSQHSLAVMLYFSRKQRLLGPHYQHGNQRLQSAPSVVCLQSEPVAGMLRGDSKVRSSD